MVDHRGKYVKIVYDTSEQTNLMPKFGECIDEDSDFIRIKTKDGIIVTVTKKFIIEISAYSIDKIIKCKKCSFIHYFTTNQPKKCRMCGSALGSRKTILTDNDCDASVEQQRSPDEKEPSC